MTKAVNTTADDFNKSREALLEENGRAVATVSGLAADAEESGVEAKRAVEEQVRPYATNCRGSNKMTNYGVDYFFYSRMLCILFTLSLSPDFVFSRFPSLFYFDFFSPSKINGLTPK